MKEHRLIERMIPVLEKNLQKSKESQTVDIEFITAAIDFFKTYADKTHHGKEEDILFKFLKKIQISREHKTIMDQLLKDHRTSRAIIDTLETANHRYRQGDQTAMNDIQEGLQQLITLYPRHIEMEDKRFFFSIMNYFTRDECDTMLQEFFDFDKNMIHEHYHHIIEKQEKNIEQMKEQQRKTSYLRADSDNHEPHEGHHIHYEHHEHEQYEEHHDKHDLGTDLDDH